MIRINLKKGSIEIPPVNPNHEKASVKTPADITIKPIIKVQN